MPGGARAAAAARSAAAAGGEGNTTGGGRQAVAGPAASQRRLFSSRGAAGQLSVMLDAGGGQLLGLWGGAACEATLHAARAWRVSQMGGGDPHSLTSLTTPTLASFVGGGSEVYHRYGEWQRHFAPGGLSGTKHEFLIGGSYWEEGGAGWASAEEASRWAQAGFGLASLPAGNQTALASSLALAAAFGTLVLGSTQPEPPPPASPAPAPPPAAAHFAASRVSPLVRALACHTNFQGLVLGSGGVELPQVAAASDALRWEANWMLPLLVDVPSPSLALRLAVEAAAPLAAVSLPPPPAATSAVNLARAGAATAWGQAVVERVSDLTAAVRNHTGRTSRPVAEYMAPAVSLNACATESDSMLRFQAYVSALLGARLLWWEGIGRCARIGTPKFELIASINRRVAQWASPLQSEDASRYILRGAYSSSSGLNFPPIFARHDAVNTSLVPVGRPGALATDLVQSMAPDALALHYVSPNPAPRYGNPAHLLLVLSTALSESKGGAAARPLELRLRGDVATVQPIEPDLLQGYGDQDQSWGPNGAYDSIVQEEPANFAGLGRCNIKWMGPRAPLLLPGGGVQLLGIDFGPARRRPLLTYSEYTHIDLALSRLLEVD